MSELRTPLPRYGESRRGVRPIDVEQAADALLRAGERPTIEKVRARLGTGSPNTINPLLDLWWKKIGAPGRWLTKLIAIHKFAASCSGWVWRKSNWLSGPSKTILCEPKTGGSKRADPKGRLFRTTSRTLCRRIPNYYRPV